jgi:hypothetical protein
MAKKYSLIRGRALRVTRLDGCGNPVPGPDSVVATKGFISVGLTANTEEGEAISVTNANGDICISDTPAPKFTGYGVEVSLCGVDPNLVNLMTNQPLVYDGSATPEAVGFRVNSKVDLDDSGFSIEMWSGVPAAVCEPGQSQQFGYFLLPFLKGGVLGDLTIENGPVNFSITGAQTKDGSSWGVGPYNVVTDEDGDASPLLEPIDPNDHLHVQLTNVAPPVTENAPTALGVPATGVTAGIPGAAVPANSYFPADFAELDASTLAPSVTTAWTNNQYIRLRDGSTAHWAGTTAKWEVGPA